MRTPLTPHSSESEGFAQSLRSFAGSLSARCGGPCKNPSLSVGFAALRAPHPFPLAAWALANYLKLTALRPLGFSRTSPYRSKLLTALHEKSPALCAELQIVCGEGGIRTPGAFQLNSFQDCRNRPLYHLSSMYPLGEGSAKICNNLLLCKHFPKKDFENLATGAVTPRA